MEYRLRRHDGAYRYLLDRGVPYHNDDGAFAGFIGSCVDVQEQHELERAKTTFLSLMAHELRTPLSALADHVEVVRRKVNAGVAPPAHTVEKITRQVRLFAALIDDLIDAAHAEEGRALRVTLAPMDLAAFAREQVALFTEGLTVYDVSAGSKHSVVADIADGPWLVQGDTLRLGRVAMNLLENARKYSPAGGEIRVGLRAEGDELRLSVTDHGIGVPASEVASLSRRYFRASNASPDHFPGVGLGLALAREVATAHGGRIEIESALGRGTTVTLVLPKGAAR